MKPGRLAQSGASLTANQGVTGSRRFIIISIALIQEGQMSIYGESMCTKYWLTA